MHPVTEGSPDAILSAAVGGSGPASPLPTGVEGLTEGHWDVISAPLFPPVAGSGEGVGTQEPIELLYPIVPKRNRNRLLYRDDNKSWKAVQKSQFRWGHEFITLKYRIHKAIYMNTVYKFLEDNAGVLVELSTPGVQPFFNSAGLETNIVYVKKFTRPKRDKQKTWRIDITFLFDPN